MAELDPQPRANDRVRRSRSRRRKEAEFSDKFAGLCSASSRRRLLCPWPWPPTELCNGQPFQRRLNSQMRHIYNILFTIFFWLSAPYYFLKMWRRGNWRTGFRQRFGRYNAKVKQAVTNRHILWIHAVSVGEVNVSTQLIRALEPRVPNLKVIVSATTSTGMQELHRKLPSHILKVYYPIDRHKY